MRLNPLCHHVTAEPPPRRGWVVPRRWLIAGFVLVALLVPGPVAVADSLAQAASVDQVLTNIRNWVMGILASLATVFFSFGAVRYLMAGGDPGEIEKAKTAFKAAGIGYGMCALAPLIVTVLAGIVGV